MLQFADLKGLYRAIHARWQSTSSSTFTDADPWQTLGRNHQHLVVMPPWECGQVDTPGGPNGFWIFGKLAAQQNMTTNSFYAPRLSRKQVGFFCGEQAISLIRNGLDEKTAYVFENTAMVLGLNLRGHYCRKVDGTILCSMDDAREGLDGILLAELPVMPTDKLIAISATDVQSNKFFGLGWSVPEAWGRWTNGPEAVMVLRVADRSREAVVYLSMVAFVPSRHEQRVEISANGSTLGTWFFDPTRQDAEISLRIPAGSIDSDGIVVLTFRMPDSISPSAIGKSNDLRLLGIGIKGLQLAQQ